MNYGTGPKAREYSALKHGHLTGQNIGSESIEPGLRDTELK